LSREERDGRIKEMDFRLGGIAKHAAWVKASKREKAPHRNKSTEKEAWQCKP